MITSQYIVAGIFVQGLFVGVWLLAAAIWTRFAPRKIKANVASIESAPSKALELPSDRWFYPSDLSNDLCGVDLPRRVKDEVFACAFEYSRCVIPHWTNWNRYVAFMRIIVIGVIAEFRGGLVDVTSNERILGYDLDEVLAALFEGTPGHAAMAREYKSFLLVTSEKTSTKLNNDLFRRYIHALAKSPRQWFRMRDADALARFTIAAALACNDQDHIWFSDAQFEILTEIGDTLYDSVAFYKHRSEGETNSTFAYMPPDIRVRLFKQYREVLWALDTAWASQKADHQAVMNFIRFFGGPIHMMMRRYRFVEEGLTVGRPETDEVITQARGNCKLWNRVGSKDADRKTSPRWKYLVSRSEELMFPGLLNFLEAAENDVRCEKCWYRETYGAKQIHQFGGVQLCQTCRHQWREYAATIVARSIKAFPELGDVMGTVVGVEKRD